jgi:hypothetical protein
MTSTPEQTETAATATAEPQATKKSRVGPRRAHVAPVKPKSAKTARSTNKAPKSAKKAKGPKNTGSPRDGSKASKILNLLKHPNGATAKELMKVTAWQPHSVRGFISMLRKKGFKITASTNDGGDRCYRIGSSK